MKAMAAAASTTLTRAIAILNALGEGGAEGMGVTQIAHQVGREKSQVSRTLKTLAQTGFVVRDTETLRYRLGWRLFTLATSATDQQLMMLAPGVLQRLVSRVRERAFLSVLEMRDALIVCSESPLRTIQATGSIGRASPLYSTSAGRALLFDHSEEEIRNLLAEVEFTVGGPNMPADVDEMLARLDNARRRGYAAVSEEFESGLVGVAAPVRDFRGRIVAAVNISGPKFRIGSVLAEAGREVRAAADHLTRDLNGTPPEQFIPPAGNQMQSIS